MTRIDNAKLVLMSIPPDQLFLIFQEQINSLPTYEEKRVIFQLYEKLREAQKMS